ncbi:MAG: hypothetical protein BGO21_18335 [Dyadobacter sp. 50-39]|uniref:hypothetical protein n=1 Tax=Dyadobacter sp. 50-39 TaxID=1895756 RepID=UPI00096660FF|nr:hypothetical protein [Dyadobacter sp. 50-39]OJV14662.1 MAG: hypothetical protein BGO21_18335 [Dyadobacter sp. 50-39]
MKHLTCTFFLLAVAIAHGFAQLQLTIEPVASGFFYVVKSKTEVQISRFARKAGNADLADVDSEVKILTIHTPVLPNK